MGEEAVPELPEGAQVEQEEWEAFYDTFSHARYRTLVRVLRRVPSEPRCGICGSPFGGMGGRIMRVLGKSPSRKNPQWCSLCFEESPPGGATLPVGVLFADVRGSTELGESLPPDEVVRLLNAFYRVASTVVLRHGLVDKLIGDEVMGLYLPPLSPDGRYLETMVADARRLLLGLGYGSTAGPSLGVGIGLAAGPAFVGHVGEGEVSDFTAIGDPVNTAARLQGEAGPGQIVLPEEMAGRAGLAPEEGEEVELALKGKARPLAARVLTVAA